MLTEKSEQPPARRPHHAPTPGSLDDLICYFEGDWVPMRDAKVSIMTHAFMYGTATFEGIRAYWNAEQGALRPEDPRARRADPPVVPDPADEERPVGRRADRLIVETVRRNGFREDAYIRPSFYKSTKAIGVRLHDLENELYIIALPFGNYIDTDAGVRVMTSSWRRNADEALPARGKIVGGYVNMAFQKSEAELNGFDEAIVLTAGGHVNEASAANVFVVRDGVALTPPVNDDLLEGVTRKAIIELLANEGIPIEVRSIDRSELYVADEMFLCGTGVQISPVIEVDHRPVGSGEVGPIAPAGPRPLLRRGARPPARVQPLADADRSRRPPATGRAAGSGRAARPRASRRSRWPIGDRVDVRAADAPGSRHVGVIVRCTPNVCSRYGDRRRESRLGAVVDDDRGVAGTAPGRLLARRRRRHARGSRGTPARSRARPLSLRAVEHPDRGAPPRRAPRGSPRRPGRP